MKPVLHTRQNGGGAVRETEPGLWHLEIPAGPGGVYRWAQLDDYQGLPRGQFLWDPRVRLDLQARVSAEDLPGTWGFGLWNDPFSASFGLVGMNARLPALPNTAWFFYAGAPNYLALRDDHPAQGFLASTFTAPRIPSLLLAPGALALPLLALRPFARLARRLARALIGESAVLVPTDPTGWHAYTVDVRKDRAAFLVDGTEIFATPFTPRGPLGLVLWIDNQYAAFPPSGKLGFGTSQNPTPAWLDMRDILVTAG